MFILLLLIVSVGAGMLLQNFRALRHLEFTASRTVWLLIFVFGISLGSNENIVRDFGRFGLSALVIAWAGVAGSVLLGWCVRRYIDKTGRK